MFMEEEIQEKLNDRVKPERRQRIEKILSKRIKMRREEILALYLVFSILL